jgi:hypothetical protein
MWWRLVVDLTGSKLQEARRYAGGLNMNYENSSLDSYDAETEMDIMQIW